MKNIEPIIFIGNNNAYSPTGHIEMSHYFNKLTIDNIVILSRDLFEGLTNTSPPFSSRRVYIVSERPGVLARGVTNTSFVSSIAEALEHIGESHKTVYVLCDKPLRESAFVEHKEQIGSTYVITIHAAIENAEAFEPLSSLEWQPLVVGEIPKDRHFAGATIVRYRNEPMNF